MPPEAVGDIMAMDAGDGNSNEGLHRRRTASCAMPPPASGGHATPSHDAATANGADDDVAAALQPVDARPSSVSGTLRLLYAACRHLVTFAVYCHGVPPPRRWPLPCPPALLPGHLLGSPHWRVAQCLVLDVILFRGLLFCYQAIQPACDCFGTQLTHSAARVGHPARLGAAGLHHLRDCDDEAPLQDGHADRSRALGGAAGEFNFIERNRPCTMWPTGSRAS